MRSNKKNVKRGLGIDVLMVAIFTGVIFFAPTIFFASKQRDRFSKDGNGRGLILPFGFGSGEAMSSGKASFLKKEDMVIFYNVYIPPTKKDQGNALWIVKGQLKRRGESKAANATVNYVQIGANIPFPCHQCNQIEHHESGDEVLTIQHLYEYCVANQDSKVVYIHDKGSFHPSYKNRKYEQMLTKSVFTDECLDITPDKCTVCAARFTPFPAITSPGNMFVAHCSYVRHLIPPVKFHDAMLSMYNMIESNIYLKLKYRYRKRPSWMGLHRYAMEQWIHSHPANKPCDVLREDWTAGYKRLPDTTEWVPDLRKAPSFSWDHLSNHGRDFASTWYDVPGRLFAYQYLYGEQPGLDWWGWEFYANKDATSGDEESEFGIESFA